MVAAIVVFLSPFRPAKSLFQRNRADREGWTLAAAGWNANFDWLPLSSIYGWTWTSPFIRYSLHFGQKCARLSLHTHTCRPFITSPHGLSSLFLSLSQCLSLSLFFLQFSFTFYNCKERCQPRGANNILQPAKGNGGERHGHRWGVYVRYHNSDLPFSIHNWPLHRMRVAAASASIKVQSVGGVAMSASVKHISTGLRLSYLTLSKITIFSPLFLSPKKAQAAILWLDQSFDKI